MYQENITSLDAILSTIKTDGQVYRWFTCLVLHPQIRERIGQEEMIDENYERINSSIKYHRIMLGVVFLSLVCILIFHKYIYLWGILIFVYPYLKIDHNKRIAVIKISSHLMTLDYPPTVLQKTTLYQIGEQYSRRYHMPSLVDTIYHLDNCSRHAIIILYVILGLIWSLNSLLILFILILAYYVINAFLKSNKFYRFLS